MTEQQATYNEELYLIKGKTTIILSKAWKEVSEPEKEQLQKILQALRLSIASVQIIHQPKLDLNDFHPQPARIIYFGDPVPGLALYECIKTEGTVVLAPHLSLLIGDAAGKQKLWVALKQLFSL